MGKTTVDFKATLLPSKTIPVKFKNQGEVAAGYKLTGIDYSSTEVVVAGTEENLKKIDFIEISANAIDITNLNANKDFIINVKTYLPSFISLVSDSKITATAKISVIKEKEFKINLDSVNLLNLPEGCSLSYDTVKELTIVLTGIESAVNTVVAGDLKPTIDTNNFVIGKNNAVLSVTLPAGVSLKQVYNIDVTLSNKEVTGTTAADSTTSATTAAN